MKNTLRGFYFITDAGSSRAGIISDARNAIAAGVRVVQLREKRASLRRMYAQACALKRLCDHAGQTPGHPRPLLLINDRVDLALAVGADGVHLGQDDMPVSRARRLLGPDKIVGLSVGTLEQARRALQEHIDYMAVGPVFATAIKPDVPAVGLELARRVRRITALPLVAIGGITPENAGLVIAAGADAVCALRAVGAAADVKARVEEFQSLFCPRERGREDG
jgi:thiamine-phosphate pyrophosphorylase